MNILKTIAIGMFALLTTAANASSLEQIKNATYELYANGDSICTGQFVSPTKFLTAAHCVLHDKTAKFSIKVDRYDETASFDLQLKYLNERLDTASFDVVDKSAAFPFVDVADNDFKPSVGQAVTVVGFPGAEDRLLVVNGNFSGTVDNIKGWDNSGVHYLINANTQSGNSGSGLYAQIDGTWKLIGTLSGGPYQSLWVSYFSTAAGVHSVL